MRFVAGRGAVVAKLLRPGDTTEQDAAGRGALEETLAGCTVVDLLARAPRRFCWPRVPWRRGWRHRGRSGSIGKKLQGDGAVHKKTCRGIGVRNLGRCAMIILLLKTH